MSLRVALFTRDSPLSAEAVAAALALPGVRVVLLGQSLPYRPGAGGALAQLWRHWRRSGWRLLPYLLVNYALPGGLPRLARARGLPLLPVADVNGPAMAAALRQAAPDLLVSLHFDQIFTAETLALAPLGGVNLHPSLLPAGRGPVPVLWALAEPEPVLGVTLHRLVPRIDAGAVLGQQVVALPPGISASAATRALHLAGVELLAAHLAQPAAEGVAVPVLPYCPFPPPAMLRGLARRGRRLVRMCDLVMAVRLALDPNRASRQCRGEKKAG